MDLGNGYLREVTPRLGGLGASACSSVGSPLAVSLPQRQA